MNDNAPQETSPDKNQNAPAVCGPGCDCSSPSPRYGVKVTITVVMILAIVGILASKTWNGGQSKAETAKAGAAYTVTSDTGSAAPARAKEGDAAGSTLKSLAELNSVALEHDAVFIFIPAGKSEKIGAATREAVDETRATLAARNVRVGFYTLQADSPDYPKIAQEAKAPAILVISKGCDRLAVSGEVTETRLLQAFLAVSSSRGCGTGSSCGTGCN